MRSSRRLILSAVISASLLASASVRADDSGTPLTKQQCVDANTQAQSLRSSGNLIEARDQLRMCTRAECPDVVKTDCVQRFDEIDHALPTIVFSAKNGAGQDVSDVAVSLDGKPLAPKLDGRALEVNPGDHDFTFEMHGETPTTVHLVVREMEKGRREAVTVGKPAPVMSPQPRQSASPEDGSQAGNTQRILGLAVAGVGVVALGVGTIFGVVAIGDKSNAHCDANNACDPGSLSGMKTAALISDIGLIGGGVLVAGGVTLWLLAPKGASAEKSALMIAPTAGSGGGGLILRGAF